MALLPLIGHLAARERIAQASRIGRVPQVIVLSGPTGVGKQRLALWLAQLLLCERRADEACGGCPSCRLVERFSHPDLHWIVPVPRPKAGDADRQRDEVAEAIGQVMADRRKQPLYSPADGMALHGIATVRLIQREAALTPVQGGCRVFIMGEADRLVPQDANPDAANALLKLLEEPPTGTTFILTTTDARRLLPTIRSRAVIVRLGRLRDEEVRHFLLAHLRPLPARPTLEEMVAAGAGSIGAALVGSEDKSKARGAAGAVIDAVLAGRGASLERALKQNPWSARGDFAAMLDALLDTLGEAAREAVGAAAGSQRTGATLADRRPDRLLRAMDHVARAREAAWGNVNPQLLLAVLGDDLAEVL